jgi:Ni/Fe-hydrogenase subunit HybB-like protein/Fe-S-cluster-containing dehydrogenase component
LFALARWSSRYRPAAKGADASEPDRRQFLKHVGCLAAAGSGTLVATEALASGSEREGAGHASGPKDPFGVLVDLTACVGCRQCEYACKQASGIEAGELKSYEDTSVFRVKRRPAPTALTVVNSWKTDAPAASPVYAKVNCMHCNHAACVSACIVGALRKNENGAVTYDAWKCIGCRYCMVACPFQIPTYEYDKALTPQVKKCTFCAPRIAKEEKPACVAACPREAMTFGKRNELIPVAHEKIKKHEGRYVDHVYGEKEVGGTSWMYLSSVKFEQAGFLSLGQAAPPALTEHIQHGVFKYWIAPVTWYSFLLATFFRTGRKRHAEHANAKPAALAAGHERVANGKDSAVIAHPPAPKAAGLADPPPHHAHHEHAPVPHKLLTPGVWALLSIVLVGVGFWIYRMTVGLAASTNLDQQRPWGLWIAMDVGSGIALAGGGFVSAAIFHVFHRERYHMLARSALVTALLGYTFYVPGLLADLGKWWKLPITMLPPMWQGNSVLFEVGMCVMIYLNVQYAELTPIICERLLGESWFKRFPRIFRVTEIAKKFLDLMMPLLLCLGVALSTFHQSSLGNLLVIAPYKLHPLWWSPLAPLHFLLSAIMVGLPMVIFTILFASWCLDREPEMEALEPLARKYLPIFTIIYLATKFGYMAWSGTWSYLLDGSYEGILWIAEMLLLLVPFVLLVVPKITRSPKRLALACLSIILGVVLNRLNVFVLAFHPPFQQKRYIPSVTEFMVSLGLVAALLLVYRVMVTYLPILEPRQKRAPA